MMLLLLIFGIGGKSTVTILARPKFGLGFGGISIPFNEVIERDLIYIYVSI